MPRKLCTQMYYTQQNAGRLMLQQGESIYPTLSKFWLQKSRELLILISLCCKIQNKTPSNE